MRWRTARNPGDDREAALHERYRSGESNGSGGDRKARAIEGRARLGERSYACRLDRSGILADKREGDGATPVGRFPLRAIRLPK